jgi:hypothetical protein
VAAPEKGCIEAGVTHMVLETADRFILFVSQKERKS